MSARGLQRCYAGIGESCFCAEECKVIDAAVMSRGIVLDFVAVLGELLID